MINKFKIYLPIFTFLISTSAFAVNFSSDKTINTDTVEQQKFNDTDLTLTIKSGKTLSRNGSMVIHVNSKNNSTIIVESDANVFSIGSSSSNAIQGKTQTGLTVTNFGTISAGSSKAINLMDAINSTVTNNDGAVIKSNTNTVTFTQNSVAEPDNATITNSGEIFAGAVTTNGSANNAVKAESDTNNITITNNATGYIHNNNNASSALNGSTIFIGAVSKGTLTNSGKIENKAGVDAFVLGVAGKGNTITLKDGGRIIGKININGEEHTIKVQHGAGQSYYYPTFGTGEYKLEDLDGNQIVKGSIGSVSQNGSENIDEQLGYRSLNLRKTLNRYKISESYNQQATWADTYASYSKRNENTGRLAMGYGMSSAAINIIRPLNDKNLILNYESSKQDFNKNHGIKKDSVLAGVSFEDKKNNNDTFILAGASRHNSKRNILTNTTASGDLDLIDNYSSYEFHFGNKFENDLAPALGINVSHSYTPKHSESQFYKWDKKHVTNLSLDLSDNYNLINSGNSKLIFSWILDGRKMFFGKSQAYSINGSEEKFFQNDNLTEEATLSLGINYEKKLLKSGKLLISFDGQQSSQDVTAINANVAYVLQM